MRTSVPSRVHLSQNLQSGKNLRKICKRETEYPESKVDDGAQAQSDRGRSPKSDEKPSWLPWLDCSCLKHISSLDCYIRVTLTQVILKNYVLIEI